MNVQRMLIEVDQRDHWVQKDETNINHLKIDFKGLLYLIDNT